MVLLLIEWLTDFPREWFSTLNTASQQFSRFSHQLVIEMLRCNLFFRYDYFDLDKRLELKTWGCQMFLHEFPLTFCLVMIPRSTSNLLSTHNRHMKGLKATIVYLQIQKLRTTAQSNFGQRRLAQIHWSVWGCCKGQYAPGAWQMIIN